MKLPIFYQVILCVVSFGKAEATDISVLQILPGGSATFDLPHETDFPSSFTACSSVYLTFPVQKFFPFFMLMVEETPLSIHLSRHHVFTAFTVQIGNEYINVHQEGQTAMRAVFPLEWIMVCLSLDSLTGRLRLVANGHLLLDKDYKDSVESFWKPATIEVRLLLDLPDKGKNSGKISNVNMFSSAISLERMKQLTDAGGEECGTFGDWLSWENAAAWNRTGNATFLTVTDPRDDPCWKASQLHVYLGDFNQPMCMLHCQKIVGGRSPPVGTLDEWRNYTNKLDAITKYSSQLGFIWLASTEGSSLGGKLTRLEHWPKKITPDSGVWRDFYTGEISESFISVERPSPNAHCIFMRNYWKSEPSGFQVGCDLTDELSCACQYDRHPPVLRLLGLCSTKI